MKDQGIAHIEHQGQLYAIVIFDRFAKPGVTFLTDDDLSQQVAFMQHPSGHKIVPHIHRKVERVVHFTQEVLIIKSGKLRVDFYDDQKTYLSSLKLGSGDLILLIKGGHGFEVLEDLEMFEVKQGPYVGDQDKTRFVAKTEGE